MLCWTTAVKICSAFEIKPSTRSISFGPQKGAANKVTRLTPNHHKAVANFSEGSEQKARLMTSPLPYTESRTNWWLTDPRQTVGESSLSDLVLAEVEAFGKRMDATGNATARLCASRLLGLLTYCYA